MKVPLLLTALLFCTITGCNSKSPDPTLPPTKTTAVSQSTPGPIRLEEATQAAGIDFTLGHDGRSPLTILETSGGGCAFLDYDGDGWPDILLVGPHNVALYHNNQKGRFENVTATSGLDPKPYWMGCTVGDYDGDGKPDIFLTGYRCFALYHNEGDGQFKDVTREAGISGLDWSISAVFADLTGSGRMDLYISQYLKFDSTTPQICQVGQIYSACGPEIYKALSGKLFVNTDGHHFALQPGWKDTGKTWGVLASDLQGTGHPSLYLANDMMQGDLWTRQGTTWKNMADASGTFGDAQGHLQGGMGVDSGDYDNDGRLDLLVTTYFAQADSLYHNDGEGLFTHTSSTSGLGPPTMPYVGFGTGFADLDNDGWLDVVITNGHVRDNVHDFDASQTYAQPVQVFHNEKGRFTDVSSGTSIDTLRLVGRGLAYADYDKDGRMDILICNLEGKAVLLRNVSEPIRHWLTVRLRSNGPNRNGIGAMLTLTANGQKQIREIHAGGVMSSHDPVAHFGLGDYAGPVTLDIRWPDGKIQTQTLPKADTEITVKGP